MENWIFVPWWPVTSSSVASTTCNNTTRQVWNIFRTVPFSHSGQFTFSHSVLKWTMQWRGHHSWQTTRIHSWPMRRHSWQTRRHSWPMRRQSWQTRRHRCPMRRHSWQTRRHWWPMRRYSWQTRRQSWQMRRYSWPMRRHSWPMWRHSLANETSQMAKEMSQLTNETSELANETSQFSKQNVACDVRVGKRLRQRTRPDWMSFRDPAAANMLNQKIYWAQGRGANTARNIYNQKVV